MKLKNRRKVKKCIRRILWIIFFIIFFPIFIIISFINWLVEHDMTFLKAMTETADELFGVFLNKKW